MTTPALATADAAAAPVDATRVLLRLAPTQIVELHCFIEGYDDLAVLRTLDAAAGIVEIFVSPGAEEEFERLRLALCREGLPTTRVEEGP
jgi:hypothetical protein